LHFTPAGILLSKQKDPGTGKAGAILNEAHNRRGVAQDAPFRISWVGVWEYVSERKRAQRAARAIADDLR
jgi:hypothetical protein